GRVEDGARDEGRLRRHEDQQPGTLARVLRRLPTRPRRLAAHLLAAERRPADAAVVLRLAVVLQPWKRLRSDPARLSRPRLGAGPLLLDRLARPADAGDRGLARVVAHRGDRLSRGLPRRPE